MAQTTSTTIVTPSTTTTVGVPAIPQPLRIDLDSGDPTPALLIAVLPVFGALAGVALTQWAQRRADRSRRDAEALDAQTRWQREEQRTAYGEFLAALHKAVRAATHYWGTQQAEVEDKATADDVIAARRLALDAYQLLDDEWAELQLIGSGEVVAQAAHTREAATYLRRIAWRPGYLRADEPDADELVAKETEKLVDLLRRDLGLRPHE